MRQLQNENGCEHFDTDNEGFHYKYCKNENKIYIFLNDRARNIFLVNAAQGDHNLDRNK